MDKHEREAVEKMKYGALTGIPGEAVGEPDPDPTEEAITLPPHRRLLTVNGAVEEVERRREKIPAAQLSKIVFKLSTGEEGEPCELSVGEARLLLTQMALLNQTIEQSHNALRKAEEVLIKLRSGGAEQAEVVDALASIKAARQ